MAVSSLSTNDFGNLIDEFEYVSGQCLTTLLQDELLNTKAGTLTDRDLINIEAEQAIAKFTDLARQVDNYFLQSSFSISVAKPEITLNHETKAIKEEIDYKDKLIQKYEDKLKIWKNVLSDNRPRHQPPALPAITHTTDQDPVLQQQYLRQIQQVPNVPSPIVQLQQKFQGPPRFM